MTIFNADAGDEWFFCLTGSIVDVVLGEWHDSYSILNKHLQLNMMLSWSQKVTAVRFAEDV